MVGDQIIRVTTYTTGSKFFKVALRSKGHKGSKKGDEGPALARLLHECLKHRSSKFDLSQGRLGALFSQIIKCYA